VFPSENVGKLCVASVRENLPLTLFFLTCSLRRNFLRNMLCLGLAAVFRMLQLLESDLARTLLFVWQALSVRLRISGFMESDESEANKVGWKNHVLPLKHTNCSGCVLPKLFENSPVSHQSNCNILRLCSPVSARMYNSLDLDETDDSVG